MNAHLLPYKDSVIHYRLWGNGKQTIICFHGYGETGDAFSFLSPLVDKTVTLLAIDLPFHGSTVWRNDTFSVDDLNEIIHRLLLEHGVGDQKISLLAFSMGGRLALSIFERNPSKIEQLILLAPDGLKLNVWYRIATLTYIGSRLFRFTMKHPGWFFITLNMVAKTGMVNSSIHKFVNHYINNREVRDLLYKRWMCMRTFRPSLQKIKKQIRANNTHVKILYGEHDKMILPVRGKKFRQGIESFCTLQIIDSGHQVLHPRNAAQILKLLES